VADADVFMCGPKRLTEDLHRQFRHRGVPARRIHFEDFEFR
jgi:predicted ferric reductase